MQISFPMGKMKSGLMLMSCKLLQHTHTVCSGPETR